MLFRHIDGKVKKLLSNQREGGKRKRQRNRKAERKKKRGVFGSKEIEMR